MKQPLIYKAPSPTHIQAFSTDASARLAATVDPRLGATGVQTGFSEFLADLMTAYADHLSKQE